MKILILEVPDEVEAEQVFHALTEAREELISHEEVCEDKEHLKYVTECINTLVGMEWAFHKEARGSARVGGGSP